MGRKGTDEIPELLAPAGSLEAFFASVNAGADAVYLSGKSFGARGYAPNFDRAELKDVLDYAHARGVKVYVTVNTLVLEREMEELAGYLVWLYQIGVDALLVQDAGVASIARNLVPNLPLHASTQMTIHSSEGASWASLMGFERVVLARELTLLEVLEISEAVPEIGLEIFAHGALCYCYSGQCLLSSAIGGRSGNRGVCAQPCRKPYSLAKGNRDRYGRYQDLDKVETSGRYLMSTRDLCLYPHLERIARMPIEAIKIEGRMRSPEYVAIVVSLYRRGLDAVARGAWSAGDDAERAWLPGVEDLRDLRLAYSRSFTDGYLLGAGGRELMGIERPDRRGILVGRVTSYDPKRSQVTVRLSSDLGLERGDGIVFRRSGEEIGMVLRESPEERKGSISLRVTRPVLPGSDLELTRRQALVERAEEIISASRKVVPLDLKITWDGGVPIVEGLMPGTGSEPIRVVMRGDFRMEPAISRPMREEQIISQIQKTGISPFFIRNIEIDYPGGLFAPIGELNRLRRELLDRAFEALVASHRPAAGDIEAALKRLEIWAEKLASMPKVASMWSVAAAPAVAREFGTVTRAPSMAKSSVETKGPEAANLPRTIRREKLSISVYASSLASVMGAAEGGCDRVYFEPLVSIDEECTGLFGKPNQKSGQIGRSHPDGGIIHQITEALEICRSHSVELVWKWPKITRRRFLDFASLALEDVAPGLEDAAGAVAGGVMVEGMGAAMAVRKVAPDMRLSGSVGLNVWNSFTVESLAPTFQRLTLSPELSAKEMADLASRAKALDRCPELEMIAEGNIEAVVSEDCLPETALGDQGWTEAPFLGIVDSRRRVFPLWIDGEGRTHILNSVETCLVDKLPIILEIDADSIAIDARSRTGRYAKEMTEIYREAVKIALLGGREGDLLALKEQARKISIGGITAGAFIKGRRESRGGSGERG